MSNRHLHHEKEALPQDSEVVQIEEMEENDYENQNQSMQLKSSKAMALAIANDSMHLQTQVNGSSRMFAHRPNTHMTNFEDASSNEAAHTVADGAPEYHLAEQRRSTGG